MKSKIKISILTTLLLISNGMGSFLKNKANTNKMETKSVMGTATNDPKDSAIEALTYGYLENQEEKLNLPFKAQEGTRSPQIIDKIVKVTQDKVSSDAEIVGNRGDNYYDGSMTLSASNQECMLYSSLPHECINNSHCGWCDNIKECVKGNRNGPIGNSCKSNYFIYFAPGRDWDPLSQKKPAPISISYDDNLTFH